MKKVRDLMYRIASSFERVGGFLDGYKGAIRGENFLNLKKKKRISMKKLIL
jgi:hypothetical protein